MTGDVTAHPLAAQVAEPPKLPKVDGASAEEGKDSTSSDAEGGADKSSETTGKGGLSEEEATELSGWIKTTLSARVSEVATTDRLVDSPAIISDHDNAVTRRMMQVPPVPCCLRLPPVPCCNLLCCYLLPAALLPPPPPEHQAPGACVHARAF